MITHRAMTPKKQNTKGHEPIMLRIRSAERSPSVSWSPERTPGCRCQNVCQPRLGIYTMVAHHHRGTGDRKKGFSPPSKVPTGHPSEVPEQSSDVGKERRRFA